MAARVDPELAKALASAPDRVIEAIVRCEGALDATLAALPGEIEVVHVYRLIDGAAVRGPAAAIAGLARMPGVTSLEPVRAVST
ncbi:MAG: hypothetical protein ACK2UL_09160 [Anaerolineae bacterium]